MTAPKNTFLDEREALLGVAVGKKGIGKTFETLKMIKEYVLGNIELGIAPRRVLIFDVNNEFRQFPTIAIADIKGWSDRGHIEVRRVEIFKSKADVFLNVNGKSLYNTPTGKMSLNEMAQALFYILEYYHTGLLLIEDINKYVSDSLPNDLIGAICTQRHKGVDIMIHFQNIGRFGHPKILGNANYLRFHKVSDLVARHESKFEDIYEPLCIMEKLVNSRYKQAQENKKAGRYKDKYSFKKDLSFHCYWDADDEKIKGAFTKEDFVYACRDFLQANYNKIVRPKTSLKKLGTGELLYKDQRELIGSLIRNYISEYYGN